MVAFFGREIVCWRHRALRSKMLQLDWQQLFTLSISIAETISVRAASTGSCSCCFARHAPDVDRSGIPTAGADDHADAAQTRWQANTLHCGFFSFDDRILEGFTRLDQFSFP